MILTSALNDTMATTRSRISPAGSSSFAWPLLNLRTEKVCVIFKPAFVQPIRNCITWGFGARFHAIPWLMRIRYVIGTFMPTLHKYLLAKPESFTQMKTLEFIWNKPYMLWILRLSTYVCLSSHGHCLGRKKEL